MPLQALAVSARIADRYASYLTTTFHLAVPPLREALHACLRTECVQGPFLQATPPFALADDTRTLVRRGELHPAWEGAPPEIRERRWYVHQVAAMRRLLAGRHLVLATGTGSGKTEAFLVPILDHLVREHAEGTLGPGVRALLLYPMNALANDQLHRVRRLTAAFPFVTFGRYTGQTPERREEALRAYRALHGHEPPPGELIDRESMRRRPPHLLVTNYAMLEYLLERPADAPLLEPPPGGLRFLVLDEVHRYRGAVGMEMGMLVRRVRYRLAGEDLRCVGTSATLGRGAEDREAVAAFARELFEVPFAREDVVVAVRALDPAPPTTWTPRPGLLQAVRDLVRGGTPPPRWGETVRRFAVPEEVTGQVEAAEEADAALWHLLRTATPLVWLRERLAEGPAELRVLVRQAVAAGVLAAEEAEDEVLALIDLAARARPTPTSQVLLPSRFHLFVRALTGVHAALHPEPRVFLDPHERTEEEPIAAVFELGACRRCGEVLLYGEEEGGRLRPPQGEAPGRWFAWGETAAEAAVDEDEADPDDLPEAAVSPSWRLCLGCGRIHGPDAAACPEDGLATVPCGPWPPARAAANGTSGGCTRGATDRRRCWRRRSSRRRPPPRGRTAAARACSASRTGGRTRPSSPPTCSPTTRTSSSGT